MRWFAIAVTLVTLVFVGAGCGGGSDEASSDTDTVVATDTIGSEDTSTDETSTDETSTDDSGITSSDDFNWASEDCQNLVKAFVGLSAAVGAASGGSDVSGDVEEFAKYADEVPDEIKADVQTLAAAYSTYIDKLKDLGLTAGDIPTAAQAQQLQEAAQSLGTSEVSAAGDRLTAWTNENCSK